MKPKKAAYPQLVVARWRRQFSSLRDTRRRRGKRHSLVDVVLIALLGMLCGCDDADEIADWASERCDLLSEWFELEHGPPSQDTILRVFSLLNPKAFSRSMRGWLVRLGPQMVGRHIAVDGKSLRGSLRRETKGKMVHLVSAWLRDGGLCLGQLKTSSKSNEMKTIPALLAQLDLRGSTVTIDAAGCYKDVVQTIVGQKGDYCIAVKANQPTLHADVQRLFVEGLDGRSRTVDELEQPVVEAFADTDGGHGRIEERTAYVSTDLDYLTSAEHWPGLRAVGMVVSTTTDATTGEISTDRRYYMLSHAQPSAAQLLALTRGHWSIESMHWVLDVVFKEDAARILDRRAAENFSLLRKTVLGMLKTAPPPKRAVSSKGMSLKRRRRHCGWRPEYMLEVVAASLPGLAAQLDDGVARTPTSLGVTTAA